MVSLLSEFRATLPFLQLRSGERDQNIINEVGAALLPRSGLVRRQEADGQNLYLNFRRVPNSDVRLHSYKLFLFS